MVKVFVELKMLKQDTSRNLVVSQKLSVQHRKLNVSGKRTLIVRIRRKQTRMLKLKKVKQRHL